MLQSSNALTIQRSSFQTNLFSLSSSIIMMNKHNFYYIFALIALLAMTNSCKKKEAPNFHFEYMGLSEGRYVIYDVVDITHDIGATIPHDTLIYQLKTHWGETYVDNEGRNSRKFRRYTRNTPADAWALKDTWYGLIDGIRGELVEENQRVVKLVFSPTQQKEWDANAYNTFAPLGCYYDDIHKSKTIGGVNYDSTVVVEQADEQNAILKIRKYEVYAKNIGLISKFYMDNDFQQSSIPENGVELYYTIVSYGFE